MLASHVATSFVFATADSQFGVNADQVLSRGEFPFASLVGAARKLNTDAARAAIVLKRIPSALRQRPRILIELPLRTPLDDPS
jgi:hypothetical protein